MKLYIPEMSGEGQYGICDKCGKGPIFDANQSYQVYDGCMGKLSGGVMNACCGHGKDSMAYVQRWTERKLMGQEAIDYINENKEGIR